MRAISARAARVSTQEIRKSESGRPRPHVTWCGNASQPMPQNKFRRLISTMALYKPTSERAKGCRTQLVSENVSPSARKTRGPKGWPVASSAWWRHGNPSRPVRRCLCTRRLQSQKGAVPMKCWLSALRAPSVYPFLRVPAGTSHSAGKTPQIPPTRHTERPSAHPFVHVKAGVIRMPLGVGSSP
jgi:hypothetical protein